MGFECLPLSECVCVRPCDVRSDSECVLYTWSVFTVSHTIQQSTHAEYYAKTGINFKQNDVLNALKIKKIPAARPTMVGTQRSPSSPFSPYHIIL